MRKICDMVVTFSNRKGGVGKSSLCVALANYWANMGLSVCLIDVDPQQSIFYARCEDLKMYKEIPKYDILKFDLMNNVEKFPEYLRFQKKSGCHILFDVPGGVENEIFMHVVLLSDFVIVPFQYESYSLDTTGRYGRALQMLKEAFPEYHRTVIYVPNMVDTRIGRASDRKAWDKWDERIESVGGIKSPRIPLRACIQRRNTLFLTPNEEVCLSPCFEFLTKMVFPEMDTKTI